MYTDKVMEHFKHPRNVGEIADADGVGHFTNPACGDTMKLYIKVENDVISQAKWQTLGCTAAIASSSIASEMITGMPITQASKLTNKAISEALGGLPPAKIHCSVLAADALIEALKDYEQRRGKGVPAAYSRQP